MGIRHRELPAEGVQFHPESVLTQPARRCCANFLGGAADDGGGRARPGELVRAYVDACNARDWERRVRAAARGLRDGRVRHLPGRRDDLGHERGAPLLPRLRDALVGGGLAAA